MREATIKGPDDGEMFYAGGDRYRFLAEVGDTDSTYGLIEAIVPPGGGPPPHSHSREEEGFYVVEGEVTVQVNGREVVAGPGSFVNMPKGSVHSFRNNTHATAKMLILLAPGGMEQMFRETGTVATDAGAPIPPLGDAERERMKAAFPKYGIEFPEGDH